MRFNPIKEQIEQANKIKAHINLEDLKSSKNYNKEALVNCLSLEVAKALKNNPDNFYLLSLKRRIKNDLIKQCVDLYGHIVEVVGNFNSEGAVLNKTKLGQFLITN